MESADLQEESLKTNQNRKAGPIEGLMKKRLRGIPEKQGKMLATKKGKRATNFQTQRALKRKEREVLSEPAKLLRILTTRK